MASEVLESADRALLEQALQQGGVVVERPKPGLLEYVGEVVARVGKTIIEAIQRLVESSGGASLLGFLLVVVAIAALLLLGLLLIRLWQARSRPLPARTELRPATAAPELRVPEDWEAQVESRLAGGDIHAALEALWWWLAGSLGSVAAERSWTTRELVLRAGRRDLLRAVLPFDRLLYAAGDPGVDDVRGVFSTLRSALAGERAR